MKVYYQNFGIRNILKQKIKKIYRNTLIETQINYQGFSVNVKFVTEEEIQNLNMTYRKIDKVTDVLSFPYLNLEKGKNFNSTELKSQINQEDGLICLGDIAICKNIAKLQAKMYGHGFKREVCFLALHGFLHLLGYDHENKKDEEEMFTLAENILKKNKVVRNV